MSKSPRLGNGSAHCNGSWIVRTRIRACPSACPTVETVTASRRGTDRDSHSTVFPSTGGTYGATGPMGHREIVLCRECRRIGLVGGRSNRVRDSSATAPVCPDVPHAGRTVLRGSCGYGVTRAGHPRKRLC